jgi:hypothetical protein
MADNKTNKEKEGKGKERKKERKRERGREKGRQKGREVDTVYFR